MPRDSQSKIDFSFLGAGLFACVMILMLFGFGMMIFGATANLYYGYCVAGAVIFSLYIIFGPWVSCTETRSPQPAARELIPTPAHDYPRAHGRTHERTHVHTLTLSHTQPSARKT